MTCPECGREHLIEGQILVDGHLIPRSWVEVLVEILCRHHKIPKPEPDPRLAPDAPDDLVPIRGTYAETLVEPDDEP